MFRRQLNKRKLPKEKYLKINNLSPFHKERYVNMIFFEYCPILGVSFYFKTVRL